MKYILKHLYILFGITVLIFLIVRSIPVSPVDMILQQYNLPLTDENRKLLILEYGLDKNIVVQYLKWVLNFFKGNFGYSFVSKLDIKDEMLKRVPYSLIIGLSSLSLSIVFSFFLGYFASINEKGIFDKILRTLSIVSQSFPLFVWVIFIIYYLGVKIKVIKFFSSGYFWGIFFSILLLTFYQVASLARVVRKSFVEQKKESYVKFYLIRGFNIKYILLRHCYKPVLYSLLSTSVSKFSSIVGGSTILEFAFAIPGVSYFLISSIVARDYNVIQAYILFLYIYMVIVHISLDCILKLLREKRSE